MAPRYIYTYVFVNVCIFLYCIDTCFRPQYIYPPGQIINCCSLAASEISHNVFTHCSVQICMNLSEHQVPYCLNYPTWWVLYFHPTSMVRWKYLYQLNARSQRAHRWGWPLNILALWIGSGGQVCVSFDMSGTPQHGRRYIYVYICVCTYMYIYIHVCIRAYTYVYMYTYMYIYIYIHMYICVRAVVYHSCQKRPCQKRHTHGRPM